MPLLAIALWNQKWYMELVISDLGIMLVMVGKIEVTFMELLF
jgi:hypothetical protein